MPEIMELIRSITKNGHLDEEQETKRSYLCEFFRELGNNQWARALIYIVTEFDNRTINVIGFDILLTSIYIIWWKSNSSDLLPQQN